MGALDEFPYPFDKPMAHELVRHMANQFTTPDDALALAAKHGVDPLEIPDNLSALNLWRQILKRTAIAGTTRDLVKEARDLQPRNPRVAFLNALLADQPAAVSAEPKGPPAFSASVSRKEALLFYDDLTMPMGRVPSLVATLSAIVKVAPCVCRLRVECVDGEFFGTGFRIGRDLLLTDEHVLVPKDKPALKVHADFGVDVDVSGQATQVVTLEGDIATIVVDAADDWGVVRVRGMRNEWPTLDLTVAPAPKTGDLAYIVQHPSGQAKRLGFVRNVISAVDDRTVQYLTDTQPGSSGSPVLDSAGRVIALHYLAGEPVVILGKPPLSKNEGIRISRVVAGLQQKGIVLP